MLTDEAVNPAGLQIRLREIASAMEELRQELKLFRRLGFGLGLKAIEMAVLEQERLECLALLQAHGCRPHCETKDDSPLSLVRQAFRRGALGLGLVLVVFRSVSVGVQKARLPRRASQSEQTLLPRPNI